MEHQIKILKNYADRILSGEKDFEVRLNDRDYQKGDTLLFTVIAGEDGVKTIGYSVMKREIKYIHTGLGMKENYVILGLKEVE